MKILEAIQTRDTGKRVYPTRPMTTRVNREVEQLDHMHWPPNLIEVRHDLSWHTRTLRPEDAGKDWYDFNEKRVVRMFAETLFGDVTADLLQILLYVQENHYDPELSEMLNNLIRELRP